MPDHQITELDSGLRVITEHVPTVRSAAIGFFIACGSRGESEEQAGLSHFIEHLMFKGTENYASSQIDQLFDGMGAELNAGTDKETTSLFVRLLDHHLPEAITAMADMVWRPTFKEIATERAVVLEEIAMYQDDPQESVFDVLGAAVFGDHPLGRAIIGHADVIRDTPAEVIAQFHAKHYLPTSVVLAAAGSVDHEQIVELARQTGPKDGLEQPFLTAEHPANAPLSPTPQIRFEQKETEQCHVCIGGIGLPRGDDRRFAALVLDAIFGGLPSSRLFQAIREHRGLAYAIMSFIGSFSDTGQAGIYLGTRNDNLEEALSVVATEIEHLRENPATIEELHRARENVKARVVLALESTSTRMSRIGSSILFDLPLLEVDELMARIDAVTHEDLAELAELFWTPQHLSAAAIGPNEDSFRNAISGIGAVKV